MADDAKNADKAAGADGSADDNKDTSKKAGKDKAGNKKDADGGDQKSKDDKPKPISFDSQDDLDDFIKTRIARDRRTRNKAEGADDDDADDDDKKKSNKRTAKVDPEKEELKRKAQLSDAKDDFIVKTNLPYEKALRIFNIYKSDIEFDESGKPLNSKELIKTARDEYPELFPPKVGGKGDGGGGDNKQAAGSSMDDFLRSGRRR